MLGIADLYAYLCRSLEIQGANNGKSAYDDVIVLHSHRTISTEEIVDLFKNYYEFRNTIIEPSKESANWVYFRARTTGALVSGVCITQHNETLTMVFGDASLPPSRRDL